jgi:signal transduction histidine kinase
MSAKGLPMPTVETAADSPGQGATVVDCATGVASQCVILPPLDAAGQSRRLASVGLMSTGIAHDLGNLMQIIEAGMRGIERRFDKTTSPELRLLSREVRGAAARACALSRRILDHSRGAADEVESIDIGAVVAELRALIGWAAGPAIRVVLQVEPRLPKVRCAPAELETAVINLVVNARHAMPDGGALTLSIRGHGKTVMLRVADTGCGMSAATARHACEPFASGRTRSGGSGLGLAIVRAFVEGLGGSIAVDSTLGRGTAIILIFPGT